MLCDPIFVLLLIPLLNWGVYPLLERHQLHLGMSWRISRDSFLYWNHLISFRMILIGYFPTFYSHWHGYESAVCPERRLGGTLASRSVATRVSYVITFFSSMTNSIIDNPNWLIQLILKLNRHWTNQTISGVSYNASSLSILWQIPQYCFMGAAESFAGVAGIIATLI